MIYMIYVIYMIYPSCESFTVYNACIGVYNVLFFAVGVRGRGGGGITPNSGEMLS